MCEGGFVTFYGTAFESLAFFCIQILFLQNVLRWNRHVYILTDVLYMKCCVI